MRRLWPFLAGAAALLVVGAMVLAVAMLLAVAGARGPLARAAAPQRMGCDEAMDEAIAAARAAGRAAWNEQMLAQSVRSLAWSTLYRNVCGP